MIKNEPMELKRRRQALRHSQESLAKALGVSFRQYNRWERGVCPVPSMVWLALKVVKPRDQE